MRERQGNEFHAGPVIPLIDQAAVGASGGTFDVEVVDAESSDEALFRTRFPALRTATIHKAMPPAFDRPPTQKWGKTTDLPERAGRVEGSGQAGPRAGRRRARRALSVSAAGARLAAPPPL